MSIMKDEILSCVEKLKECYEYNYNRVIDLANLLKDNNVKHIEIVARGSSKNACEYFKYLLESSTDIRVSFVYPSTITKYNGTLNNNTCYFAVSQGGRGEDLRMVIEKANECGCLTIALTNDENTPLNKVSQHNLYMKVDKEYSLAATKTYSAECLVLGMLANALANKNIDEFKEVYKVFKYVNEDEVEKTAAKLMKIKNLFVLSRGLLLANGKEMCCKFQETCFINANFFAVSDFMHGPFALVDKSFNGLVFVPNDKTREDVINMIDKIKKNNGNLIIVGNYKDADIKIKDLDNVNYVFAITYALQLLACFTSEMLGNDPDTSRNLAKYTNTI